MDLGKIKVAYQDMYGKEMNTESRFGAVLLPIPATS